MTIDFEVANKLLSYAPETGVFAWKERSQDDFSCGAKRASTEAKRWNTRYAGKPAGVIGKNGYVVISIFNKDYKAHRIAFLIFYKKWPKDEIDHINGDKRDNRISNLRECCHRENSQNQPMSRRNKTGYRGVFWVVADQKYTASISVNRKTVYLGQYETADEAYKVYKLAKRKHHQFSPIPREARR